MTLPAMRYYRVTVTIDFQNEIVSNLTLSLRILASSVDKAIRIAKVWLHEYRLTAKFVTAHIEV